LTGSRWFSDYLEERPKRSFDGTIPAATANDAKQLFAHRNHILAVLPRKFDVLL